MEIGQRLSELGQRYHTRDRWGKTKSEETMRMKTSENSSGNKHNIRTSIEYRIWLLFKRLYTAGLAWLSQGLRTKVLVWNKENRNGVRRLYAKDERIMVTWGQISMKQGCRNKGWNKGNRDKWRGVGDVMEIEWTWGWRRYSREEVAWDRLCQRSIEDLISNTGLKLCHLNPESSLICKTLVLFHQGHFSPGLAEAAAFILTLRAIWVRAGGESVVITEGIFYKYFCSQTKMKSSVTS